ncbi:MAG: glycosyltransferase family 4 protein [Anaerolineales bacterium]|nr:glycosyltransferase family 4 protein [Chloroflexota bacterium]MBL6980221.1 glycosyltransferase family 4 protein [Anaerolineales bacterium]
MLIINSEYPPIGGGAGNASANIARELANLGQEVTVLTVHYGDLPRYTSQDGVHVVRIKALRRRLDRSSALEQIIFMVASSISTIASLRKWQPDVIIAFFGVPCGAAAWCANIFSGVPYFVSLRGGDVPGFRPYDFALYHKLVAPLLRLIWRRSSGLVANSSGLKNLAQAFDSDAPITIIPNGVDLQRYSLSKRDWEPARLLFVGRLVYQKGIDILLAALEGLKSHPWELSLVGDGPEREALQSLVQEYGISDRVHFKCWLDGDDLMGQLQEANLFVFPSRHEGMPNAVLEAMACGLPIIASQIAGNEELVTDGENGLLFSPEDANALREALVDLLENPFRREQMGAASRRNVEAKYSWSRVAKQYLALIEKGSSKL